MFESIIIQNSKINFMWIVFILENMTYKKYTLDMVCLIHSPHLIKIKKSRYVRGILNIV